jgi:hypothetical protein
VSDENRRASFPGEQESLGDLVQGPGEPGIRAKFLADPNQHESLNDGIPVERVHAALRDYLDVGFTEAKQTRSRLCGREQLIK